MLYVGLLSFQAVEREEALSAVRHAMPDTHAVVEIEQDALSQYFDRAEGSLMPSSTEQDILDTLLSGDPVRQPT